MFAVYGMGIFPDGGTEVGIKGALSGTADFQS